MGSLGEAAAVSARGSFTLFVGDSISLLVRAFGAIMVARMLTPADFGLYSVSLVLPGLFILFSDWGIDAALVRFIAASRSGGETGLIGRLEKAGFLFKFAVGAVLSSSLFLSAEELAIVVLKRPEAAGLVRAASLLIISQSIHTTVVSALSGLERMDYRALTTMIQAVLKGVCAPLFIYYGMGVSGAIIGHVLSYAASAGIGLVLTLISSDKMGALGEGTVGLNDGLKMMLGFGLPVFAGHIVLGLANNFRGLLLSWFASDEAIGNYSVATNFRSLVALLTGAIGVALFPTFSRFRHRDEPDKTREAFRGSVRYSSVIVLPLIILLAVAAEQAVYTLYTAKYSQATLFLPLLLMTPLLVGVGSISIINFMNSQGDTGVTMKINLTTSLSFILLSPVLIWIWRVPGLIAGMAISQLLGNMYGLKVLKAKYDISPDYGHTARTLISSAISGATASVTLKTLQGSGPFPSLIVATAVYLISYLILAPSLRAIERKDVENLRTMLGDLRIIYPLIRLILSFEEKMIELIERSSK